MAAKLSRKFDHVRNHLVFISTASEPLPLCISILAERLSGAVHTHAKRLTDAVDAGTFSGEAQKFPFATSVRMSLSK